jgi:outer membrane protein assembly factor BamE
MTSAFSRRAGAPLALLASVLAGCGGMQVTENVLSAITPYRVEVVQGNVITSEQVALAKPGQTRAQVRDVLGSPLLADPFHADRWDYVFTIRRQGAEPQLRRVIVRFKADVLDTIEGAAGLPSEHDFVTSIDTFKTARNAPPLVLSDEQIKA